MNLSSLFKNIGLISFRGAVCNMVVAVTIVSGGSLLQARTLSPFLVNKAESAKTRYVSDRCQSRMTDRYIPLIIKLKNADANLPDEVVELHRRGMFVLAYVPEYLINEISLLGVISRIEGGQVCTPVLDVARQFTGFPEIENVVDLPRRYSGRDVVAGFTDIGYDPNHIEFIDPTTGRSRVKLLTDYKLNPDKCSRLETPEEIAAWTTDNRDEWHATHVAGIMAGGYAGNPYRGIAENADIVATTSELYDALLLAGMEDIVGYAREVGKPAVINMSICGNLGPHDGTSLFCQYLEDLSKEAAICISAGNLGKMVGCWDGIFPEDCATAAVTIDVPSWTRESVNGYFDIWSGNSDTFDFAVVILDYDTQKVVCREPFPLLSTDMPEVAYAIGSTADRLEQKGANSGNGHVSSDFARYLDGVVTLTTEINPENGRFNGLIGMDVTNYADETGKISWRYVVGIEVTGKKGQHLTAFTSDRLRFLEVPEYPNFARQTIDGNINDFVTGEGVIAVGAMCTRNSWPLISGETGTGDLNPGEVASFSSCYSNAPHGVLPDVVAPGAWLISSIPSVYAESHPDLIPGFCVANKINGHSYYWDYASGTSMSSPYVAGICALMSEAVPSATPADIKQAIISTLTPPTIEPYNVRWGKGILNSYAALKKLLAESGTNNITADESDSAAFSPLPVPLTAEALLRYAVENRFEIFSTDGRLVLSGNIGRGVFFLRGNGRVVKVAL